MSKLLQELQRRNAIKSSISYVALSWVFLEAADIIFPVIGVAQEYIKYLLIILIVGFPLWVVFACILEWTPSGFRKTNDAKPEKFIAVLPFTNMSNDPDQEYFSDGLTDAILDESDLVLDHLEPVLSIPIFFTVEWLKRDVRYKNIRTKPRYEDLITTYAVSYFDPTKL